MVPKRSMMIPNCAIMTDAHDRTSLPMASRSAIDAGIPPRPLAAELRRRIAGSLQGGDDSQSAGPNGGTPITKLATYHARAVETIRDMTIDEPALIVVLDGIKEVHIAGDMFEFHPGEPFVLPAGQSFDIVNRPDETSGRYRAVFITLPRDLVRRVAQAHPRRAKATVASPRKPHDPGIDLTAQTVDTISHAATALSRTDLDASLAEHRVMEILLLIGHVPAIARSDAATVAERTRHHIALAPMDPWRSQDIARLLGVSTATLRRRLAEERTSLRLILAAERMRRARAMIEDGERNIAVIAAACGYSSRSHFAASFRSAHGASPHSLIRAAGQTKARRPVVQPESSPSGDTHARQEAADFVAEGAGLR
jgi:AraC-like DNA-binding protein